MADVRAANSHFQQLQKSSAKKDLKSQLNWSWKVIDSDRRFTQSPLVADVVDLCAIYEPL